MQLIVQVEYNLRTILILFNRAIMSEFNKIHEFPTGETDTDLIDNGGRIDRTMTSKFINS